MSTRDANLQVYSDLFVPYDKFTSFSTGFIYNGGSWTIGNNLVYTKPDSTKWAGYSAIQPQSSSSLRSTTVSDIAPEFAGAASPAIRYTWYTATFLNGDYANLDGVTQAAEDLIAEKGSTIANLTLALYYETLPVSMFDAAEARGPNLMGMGSSTPQVTIWLAA